MQHLFVVVIAFAAVTAWNSSSAQAIERVASGSTLVVQLIKLSGKLGEIRADVDREVTATIHFTPSGRDLVYSTGRVERYNQRVGMVEQKTSSGTRTFEGKYLLQWLPEDSDFAAIRKTTESYTVTGCGIIDAEYTITPTDRVQKVQVRGADADIKVVEFVLDGRWISGACGSGKRVLKFTYSRELDVVVATEFATYDRLGSLIGGFGMRVTKVE